MKKKLTGDPDLDRIIQAELGRRTDRVLRGLGKQTLSVTIFLTSAIGLLIGLTWLNVAPQTIRAIGITLVIGGAAGGVVVWAIRAESLMLTAIAALAITAVHFVIASEWTNRAGNVSAILVGLVLIGVSTVALIATFDYGLPSDINAAAPVGLAALCLALGAVILWRFGMQWALGAVGIAIVIGIGTPLVRNAIRSNPMVGRRDGMALSITTKHASTMALSILLALFALLPSEPSATPPAVQLRGAASVSIALMLTAAVCGVAAMATVQVWKAVFAPRAEFHARALDREFHGCLGRLLAPRNSTRGFDSPYGRPVPEPMTSDLHPRDLRELRSLLDSPTEVIMAHLRSSAEYMMANPNEFSVELEMLAGSRWRSPMGFSGPARPDTPREAAERQADELVSLRFGCEHRLNAIHIVVRDGWQRRVRSAALFAAGVFGFAASQLGGLAVLPAMTTTVTAMLWGGAFSWFSRDVVAIAEHSRR